MASDDKPPCAAGEEAPPAQHAAANSTVSKMQDTSTSPHASEAKRILRHDESSLHAGSFRIAAGIQEEEPSSGCMATAELGTASAGESPAIADDEDDIAVALSDYEEILVRHAAEAAAEQQASDMPSMEGTDANVTSEYDSTGITITQDGVEGAGSLPDDEQSVVTDKGENSDAEEEVCSGPHPVTDNFFQNMEEQRNAISALEALKGDDSCSSDWDAMQPDGFIEKSGSLRAICGKPRDCRYMKQLEPAADLVHPSPEQSCIAWDMETSSSFATKATTAPVDDHASPDGVVSTEVAHSPLHASSTGTDPALVVESPSASVAIETATPGEASQLEFALTGASEIIRGYKVEPACQEPENWAVPGAEDASSEAAQSDSEPQLGYVLTDASDKIRKWQDQGAAGAAHSAEEGMSPTAIGTAGLLSSDEEQEAEALQDNEQQLAVVCSLQEEQLVPLKSAPQAAASMDAAELEAQPEAEVPSMDEVQEEAPSRIEGPVPEHQLVQCMQIVLQAHAKAVATYQRVTPAPIVYSCGVHQIQEPQMETRGTPTHSLHDGLEGELAAQASGLVPICAAPSVPVLASVDSFPLTADSVSTSKMAGTPNVRCRPLALVRRVLKLALVAATIVGVHHGAAGSRRSRATKNSQKQFSRKVDLLDAAAAAAAAAASDCVVYVDTSKLLNNGTPASIDA